MANLSLRLEMISYLTYGVLLAFLAVLVRYRDWATPVGQIEAAVVSALCLISVIYVTRGTPFGDFIKGYYPAGRTILEAPRGLYDCHVSEFCFVNLPILALLFAPFSFMPLPIAEAAFTILGVVLTAYTAWRLSHGAQGVRGRAVVALFALSGPFANSVRLGNMTHMLLPVLFLAFDAVSRGRTVRAGALLAFAALIKPFLTLFLIYFLLRRQFAAFLAMGATAAAAVGLSLVLFGLDLHLFFLKTFVLGFGAEPVIAYNVQNIGGFIGHLLSPSDLKNWLPIKEAGWLKYLRLSLAALVVLGVGAALARAGRPRTPTAWLAELCIVLCVALLIAPVTWTHYLCLLLIPMALLVRGEFEAATSTPPRTTAFAVATLLLSLPVVLFLHGHGLWATLTRRLWVSHFFFGELLLLSVLLAARLRLDAGLSSDPPEAERFSEKIRSLEPASR
jgi:hypothetical protein